MSLAEIKAAIPHREPFLLVDEVVERTDSRILCRKRFTGDEWFFAGHFPSRPIVPGVILCEAALQAGAILIGRQRKPSADQLPVVTRLNDVRFKQQVRPGETIDIDVTLREETGGAYFFDASVMLDGKP